MPAFHCKFSLNGAQHYFSNLNPIAKKIAQDVKDTQTTYGQLWNTLTISEQNDIINETLIKPEIAIRYYENISTPSVSCSSNSEPKDCLRGVSPNSLSTLAVRNQNAPVLPEILDSVNVQNCSQLSFSPQNYLYDRRNLLTYTQQNIGSKIVHDDVYIFRDEHSGPFSYRTRSQINLSIFVEIEEKNIINIERNVLKDSKNNCHKMQIKDKQAKHILEIANKTESKMGCYTNVSNDINKDVMESDGFFGESKLNTSPKNSKANPIPLINAAPILPKFPRLSLNSTKNYSEDELNLIQHYSSRSVLAGFSSSDASTDNEDEDKTLCTEKVKLLDSDCDMRKGFDFLNNW